MLPKFKDIDKNIAEKSLERYAGKKVPFRNTDVSKDDDKGSKKKGIANSGFTHERRDSLYDLREELHPYIPLVINELFNIMLDPNSENKDRLRCIENILNRYDGRPTERVEIVSNQDKDVSASAALKYIESVCNAIPAGSTKKVILKKGLDNSERIFKNARQ